MHSVYQAFGTAAFLVLSALGVAAIILLKLIDRSTKFPAWLVVLLAAHLVFGGLALWSGNDSAFKIATLLCWGPIIIESVVREVRKKRSGADVDEEAEASGKEEPASVRGEDWAG